MTRAIKIFDFLMNLTIFGDAWKIVEEEISELT